MFFLLVISLQVKHVQFTRASDRVFYFFWYCVKTSQVMLDRLMQQWIDHAPSHVPACNKYIGIAFLFSLTTFHIDFQFVIRVRMSRYEAL